MSVWGDIRKKSLGQEQRIENQYLTAKKITEILKSHTVGPNGNPPIKMFYFVHEDSDGYRLYSIILTAGPRRPNGERNFYTENNIELVMKDKPKIVMFENECMG